MQMIEKIKRLLKTSLRIFQIVRPQGGPIENKDCRITQSLDHSRLHKVPFQEDAKPCSSEAISLNYDLNHRPRSRTVGPTKT